MHGNITDRCKHYSMYYKNALINFEKLRRQKKESVHYALYICTTYIIRTKKKKRIRRAMKNDTFILKVF